MAKTKLIDNRMMILIGANFIAVALGCLFLKSDFSSNFPSHFSSNLFNGKSHSNANANANIFSIKKEIGVKLRTIGLENQAITMFKKSLNSGKISFNESSNLAFLIASLLEKNGKIKEAISYYLLVEKYNPKSSNKNQANKKIVALLETLKKYSASKMILSESVSLKDKSKSFKSADSIVAIVGSKKIYLGELNSQIDQLPKNAKKQFKGLKGKKMFVQKMVTDELLLQSSKRAGLDLTNDYLKSLEQVKSQMLIQSLLKKELGSKTIEFSDLKNFYKANIDKFKVKGKTPKLKSMIGQVKNAYLIEKAQNKYQELVSKLLKTEKVKFLLENVK